MTFHEYRDMYYAAANGIEIGVSMESILDEVVSQRRAGYLCRDDYDQLLSFFKDCDKKNGATVVKNSISVTEQEFREQDEGIVIKRSRRPKAVKKTTK